MSKLEAYKFTWPVYDGDHDEHHFVEIDGIRVKQPTKTTSITVTKEQFEEFLNSLSDEERKEWQQIIDESNDEQ